jgi:hypothetical protein
MIYGVLELYDYSPGHRLPDVWWWSTLTVSLLWAAGLAAERLWRTGKSFSRTKMWESFNQGAWILMDVWLFGWIPFSIVFIEVASRLLYFIEVPFKNPQLLNTPLNWLIAILAWTSCSLLTIVGTVPVPRRRGRLILLGVGAYALTKAIGTSPPAWQYATAILFILLGLTPNKLVNFIKRKTVGEWPKIDSALSTRSADLE